MTDNNPLFVRVSVLLNNLQKGVNERLYPLNGFKVLKINMNN